MFSRLIICTFLILFSTLEQNAQRVYETKYTADLAIIGTGLGMTVLGNHFIDRAPRTTLSDLVSLRSENIWGIDRGAISNNSQSAQSVSDVLLYTSVALPFITLASKPYRDEGGIMLMMAAETFMITYGITQMCKGLSHRYRPYNYNDTYDQEVQLSDGSRLSFISGHTSTTAAMSFFTAHIITHKNPNIKNKGLVWAGAALLPAIVGYTRYEAGKHFPTDILAGYAVGATVGYLVPEIHLRDNIQLGLIGVQGLSLRMNL